MGIIFFVFDVKDAYLHVMLFLYGCLAWQTLPIDFGLAMAPRVFNLPYSTYTVPLSLQGF